MSRRPDHTEEITIYVTPAMKDEISKLAVKEGLSISILGRQALAKLLKDYKR